MGAEAGGAGFGSGVDEGGGFGVRCGIGVVGTFCVVGFLVVGRWEEHVGEGDGEEAGGVDERGGGDGCGFGFLGVTAGGGDGVFTVGEAGESCNRSAVGQVTTERLEGAFEVGHQTVRVDDAGGCTFEHAGASTDVRFTVLGLFPGQETRGNVDGPGKGVYFFELIHLPVILGDDPFLAVAVADAFAAAEGVEHRLALQA